MNTLVRENRDTDRAQAEQFVVPSASVTESAEGYTLEIEMPGVKKDRLDISVENNELTIVGRRSLPTVEGMLIPVTSDFPWCERTAHSSPTRSAYKNRIR